MISITISTPSLITIFCLLSLLTVGNAESSAGSRYSFSLTTFDPTGKLGQVDRAVEAAALGVPLVAAVVAHDGVLLAAPHRLVSPLIKDDGTARFVALSPTLVVGHTGVSADGRRLVAAAHELVLNHRYTYDQDIPVDAFLRGMSSIMQEYTMKPGRRPFGSTLVVAHVPRRRRVATAAHPKPKLFRIDPSGSVTTLEDNCCIINSKGGEDINQLKARLLDAAAQNDDDDEDLHQVVSDWFHEQLLAQVKKQRMEESALPETVLVASLTANGHFRQTRNGRRETS